MAEKERATNEAILSAIEAFVDTVNCRAERNMEKTHKLEGSHYAAMCVELEKVRKRYGLAQEGS